MFSNQYHDEGVLEEFTNFNVVATCFMSQCESAILVLPLRRRPFPIILILYLSQYWCQIEEPYWIAATWNCP